MAGTYRSKKSSVRVASKLRSIGGNIGKIKSKGNKTKSKVASSQETGKAKSKLAGSTATKLAKEVKSKNAVKNSKSGAKKKVATRKRW